MVDSGKDPPSGKCIHPGVSVSPWNENTLLSLSVIILPFDGDTMSGILAGNTSKAREPLGSNALQSDEADTSNRMSLNQLRSESGGQHGASNIRCNPVVQQDTPTNRACDRGYLHFLSER